MTNENKRESIISKIRKLLALSDNNPNQNEAIAAALQAQKLMATYDIKEDEISEDEQKSVIGEVESTVKSKRGMFGQMAMAVAENFRCKVYLSTSYNIFSRANTKTAVFYGYEVDAKAASITFDYLWNACDAYAKAQASYDYRVYGTAKGTYNSAAAGFIAGVRSELEKQSQALMLVVPSDVKDSYDEFSKDFKRARAVRWSSYGESYSNGYSEGKKAVQGRRMDGQKALNA